MAKQPQKVSVLAVVILSLAAITIVHWQNTDFTTFAQSNKTKNANCSNKSGDSENYQSNKSEGNTGCDFSKYKTLKVRSLKIKSLPQPEYPPEAKEKKLKGCVPVKILVDGEGNVRESCAVQSIENPKFCADRIEDSLFEKLSEEAASKAKFDVSRLSLGNGKYFEMIIVYRFSLLD